MSKIFDEWCYNQPCKTYVVHVSHRVHIYQVDTEESTSIGYTTHTLIVGIIYPICTTPRQ